MDEAEREQLNAGLEAVYCPPKLPPPRYEVDGEPPLSKDSASASFYEACEKGNLDKVVEFVERCKPLQGDRQYGLELAAFGGQAQVIQYLLAQGTMLHEKVFERPCKCPSDQPGKGTKSIFDRAGENENGPQVLEMLKVFLQYGWHPNQMWGSPQNPSFPLRFSECIKNKPLVTLLLDHGVDPNLGGPGQAVDAAVVSHRTDIVDLLLAHGAKPDDGIPLHRLPIMMEGRHFDNHDFAKQCAMAQYLLDHGVDINGIRNVFPLCYIPIGGSRINATPLAVACAKADWRFAEWLLEKGADPDSHRGVAYGLNPHLFLLPQGMTNRLPELVKKLKGRQREEETGEQRELTFRERRA